MSSDPDTDGEEDGIVARASRSVVPDLIRRRYVAKFALVFLIVLVVIGGIGAYSYLETNSQLQDSVEGQLKATALQQSDAIYEWNRVNEERASAIASSDAAVSGDPVAIEEYLQALNSSLQTPSESDGREVLGIHHVNMDYRTVTASTSNVTGYGEYSVPLDEVDQPWASMSYLEQFQPLPGQAMVTDSAYSTDRGNVLAFVARVEETGNRIVFETSAEYRIDRLYQPYEDGRTVLFNANGDRLIPTDNTEGSYDDVVERAGTGSATFAEQDGEVLAANTVADLNWTVVSIASSGEAFAVRNVIGQNVLLILLVSLFGLTATGVILGRHTVTPLRRLTQRAEAMEQGDLDVSVETFRIDEIGRLFQQFGTMRDALRQQISEAEQARKEAEVSRAEAMEMNEYLQEKAQEYSAIMDECADGDLTQRMETDGENAAMDQIATDFNGMVEELEKTTGQLKHFADEVEEAGEVVETSAESVRDASEQVAESIQRISDDAYDQQERLEELSASIDEAIGQFERVAAEADVDVGDSIDQLREVADAINDLVELTDAMMAESENVAGAAEEQAAELNAVSQQAQNLTRYARPLRDVLDSFETEQEHEFYFPTGPGSPQSEAQD